MNGQDRTPEEGETAAPSESRPDDGAIALYRCRLCGVTYQVASDQGAQAIAVEAIAGVESQLGIVERHTCREGGEYTGIADLIGVRPIRFYELHFLQKP